jgi:predicted nucleic-acid-binding protein
MRSSRVSLPQEIANRFWKQSSTFRRLIFSRHVLDLQLIFIVTLLITAAMLWWHAQTLPNLDPNGKTISAELGKEFVGAVLLICGTILAWAYQAGSKRLGVVDLFACEIVTLCRVGTIMEVVPKLIAAHDELCLTRREEIRTAEQDINLNRFTSKEDYFPVFDKNTNDLQVLEADVVINVTAFYTYVKAFRDQLRSLAELGSEEELKPKKSSVLINAVYMLFLGYESARKSVEELIEFEPTQAEAMVTGLVTELLAYEFLAKHHDLNDMRGRRLALREKAYREIVPPLLATVFAATSPDWESARTTAIDLKRVYGQLKFNAKV